MGIRLQTVSEAVPEAMHDIVTTDEMMLFIHLFSAALAELALQPLLPAKVSFGHLYCLLQTNGVRRFDSNYHSIMI